MKALIEKTQEKNRGRLKNNILLHLLDLVLIELTVKDIPNSPKQKTGLNHNVGTVVDYLLPNTNSSKNNNPM